MDKSAKGYEIRCNQKANDAAKALNNSKLESIQGHLDRGEGNAKNLESQKNQCHIKREDCKKVDASLLKQRNENRNR
ncbi:hypothetical protein BB560_005652 [Smittium megazygosporum]|uniref:Uncharacterized protein n=1 Tax=Smittium megazygosporum TaxID=133381 RepID=A0A2T9Z1T7_9FUNG|nr:hypothetical protein BB560_005652 [Smittium megazygosporum]